MKSDSPQWGQLCGYGDNLLTLGAKQQRLPCCKRQKIHALL